MLINHTECFFFFLGGGGGGVEMHSLLSPVRAKFRCRVGVGNSTFSLYSIKTITPMETPRKP